MYPLYLPYRKSVRWGFCTPDKKIVIPCRYDRVWPFWGDTAIVEKEGKYGAVNREGKLYIPFSYTSRGRARQEIYMCEPGFLNEHWDGERSSEGPPPDEGAIRHCGGTAFVFSKGKYRLLDSAISKDTYEELAYSFLDINGGPILVKRRGRWGVIRPTGEQIIPFMYEEVEPFDDDYPEYNWVWLDGKAGIIDYDNVQYWDD